MAKMTLGMAQLRAQQEFETLAYMLRHNATRANAIKQLDVVLYWNRRVRALRKAERGQET